MLEGLFAAIVFIAMPLRAWRRRIRGAPRRIARYGVETLLLTGVLAFLLWRNGAALRDIGLSVDSAAIFILEIVTCLAVVAGPDAWAAWRIATAVQPLNRLPDVDPAFEELAAGRQRRAPFVAVMAVGAVWEELCFRATVMLLVPQTFGGLLLGVAGGSLLFGAQHLRNGIARAILASGYGVLFALLYLITGNLVAVIVAHAAGNILAGLQWTPRIEQMRRRTGTPAPSIFVG